MAIFNRLDTNFTPGRAGYGQQLNFYRFNTTATTPNYVHMKTNISCANNVIGMIEAKGFAYGTGQPVRCAWGFYAWNNTAYNRGLDTATGSGISANNLYRSADNNIVIVAYSASWYFNGFVLSGFTSNGGNMYYGMSDIQITAAIQTDVSGAYY